MQYNACTAHAPSLLTSILGSRYLKAGASRASPMAVPRVTAYMTT
jgi:hypothetical protein